MRRCSDVITPGACPPAVLTPPPDGLISRRLHAIGAGSDQRSAAVMALERIEGGLMGLKTSPRLWGEGGSETPL